MWTPADVDEQDQPSEPRSNGEGERITTVALVVIYAVAAAEVIALCMFLFLR
jgi:hypothetical protein